MKRKKKRGAGKTWWRRKKGGPRLADMDDRFVCERTDHSAVALIIIIRILMAVERLVRL